MVTKEQAREEIEKLVQKYVADEGSVKSPGYKEEWAKENFIGPLFRVLGWDVGNKEGKPFQDQEVQPQARGTKGTPDYAFRIGRATKFFLEAKKPSESLPNHVLQAKQYAWNSGDTPFALLTNFEELLIYRVLRRPTREFKEGLIEPRFFYKDYVRRFDELWALLSRETVEQGSLDAALRKRPEPKEPVSDAFLKDLEGWRIELAKDLYKRNPKIDVKIMTEVVQRMLDRLVFIRIAEDRGILEAGSLEKIADIYRSKPGAHPGPLKSLFKEVNEKLNGDIFKPHAIDEPEFQFDPTLLVKIIASLYDNHYRFDVIKVELLGTIYERYLGSVIRLTEKRVKVEEKPEVRKAGGVFYTPKYIVDYIVENTVGNLIGGKSPDEISKIRILDPACGSGSFLLGAYQKLIDHHIQWYSDHRDEAAGRVVYHGDGGLTLKLPEKARILKNNIHGVDIDPQAVEITMMSLYVKALEGQGEIPEGKDLLPRLSKNVVCGNSLIGTDAREVLGRDLTPEEARRVNCFDWRAGFPDIFGQGGFDAVIGNPPYVRQETIGEFKSYFQEKYEVFAGTADLYAYFIEKSVRLLRNNGLFSFIVSNKFLRAAYGERLRKFIPNQTRVLRFIDFGDLPVFEGATVYPCIIVLQQEQDPGKRTSNQVAVCNVKTLEFGSLEGYVESNEFSLAQERLSGGEWHLQGGETIGLIQKIRRVGRPLAQYCGREPLFGVKTGLNEVFIVDDERIRAVAKGSKKERDIFITYLRGRDVKRYRYEPTGQYLLFSDGITEKEYPNVMAYLRSHKTALEARTDIKGKMKKWYELRPCTYYDLLKKPKIIYPSVSQRGNFALDREGTFVDKTCYFIPSTDKYLLGLLNSRLLFFYFSNIAVQRRGGYYEYLTEYVSQLPIRPIDPSNLADRAAHDDLVRLVDRMLELHRQRAPLPESAERERVEREIEATDRQIDEIVYRLYGITEEERKIVEGAR